MIFRKILFISLFLFIPFFSSYAANAPVKILIVPGHDDQSWGTEFKGVKEADMNVKLSLMLYNLLKKDPKFQVYISRDWNGYTKEFSDFFKNNREEIINFYTDAEIIFDSQVRSGEVNIVQKIEHNTASDDMRVKLFGINLWANRNNVDAVIHVHFNDYARRNMGSIGDYKGFAIYAPEPQKVNSEASSSLAFFLLSALNKYYPTSNYPPESGGVIPTQTLIATGEYNTLNKNVRAVLIEYGYIYQRIFNTFTKRENEMKRMSQLTYGAIKKYFEYSRKK